MKPSDMFLYNLTLSGAMVKLDEYPPPGAGDGDTERFPSLLSVGAAAWCVIK